MKVRKRVFSFCVALLLCFSLMTATTLAAEKSTETAVVSSEEDTAVPYGTGQGHIIYPQETSFTITGGSVDYAYYTGTYGVFGSSGVIALRFTNTDTGNYKTIDFICDNSPNKYRELPVSLPAGHYTVTMVNCTVKDFFNISISFG